MKLRSVGKYMILLFCVAGLGMVVPDASADSVNDYIANRGQPVLRPFGFLKLSKCKLQSLDGLDKIDNPERVQSIDLSYNKLRSLDGLDKIGNPEKVFTIDLSHNELTEIPEGIFERFINLSCLKLQGNKIKEIHPNAFKGLSKLRNLGLTNNKLSKVPEAIRDLSYLKTLNLEFNQLTEVPNGVFDHKKLDWISISFNPLTQDWSDKQRVAFKKLHNLKNGVEIL